MDYPNFDLDEIDPEEFPESPLLWDTDRIEEFPEPYYRFGETKNVIGHVFDIVGEYADWLEEQHPDQFERLSRDHPDHISRDAPDAFELSISEECHYNRWISNSTREFIQSASTEEEPFFVWCSFPDPHHPFAAPEPWASKYDIEDIELPTRREGELEELPPFYKETFQSDDTLLRGIHGQAERSDRELREMIALTYGMTSFIDQEIGRVLDTLEECGLKENTIIVFLSDHGDMMGDHWMIRKGALPV